jgi:hypothetical protein
MDYAVSIVPGWHAGPTRFFGALGFVLLIVLFLPMLIVLTRAAITEEASVEKPSRVRQWYGYIVCLIAVVTGLITVAGVFDNAFDLSNPLAAEGPYGESLTSFDAYMATRTPRFLPPDQRTEQDTASQATLHARYDALRADRIAQRRFAAQKGLVTDLSLLVIAVGLFFSHWRWLRRLPEPEGSGRAA